MTTASNINVILSANSTSLRTQLAQAAREVDAFAKKTESAGNTATKAGSAMSAGMKVGALAVAAALVYSVAQAAKFEEQMRNVNSISKLSETQFQNLSKQVVDLSTSMPQSATTLAAGLYDIASSGFQGAEGMTVLKASALAASAGMSDTATAAKGITAVLNAYGLTAKDAAYVSDVLFQTVNLGVVTFGELAMQLGDVVGTAAAAHVSIAEVGAAVAAMTLAGISGAESTTSLNRLITSLIQPSEALAAVYKQLGYESGAAELQTRGLHAVMEDLRKVTGGNIETLLQLFPEIRSARGAFALMAADGANYAKTFDAIGDKTKVAGATQAAFNEQMKSLTNQIKLFLNQVNAAAIELGTKLLPAVKDGLDAMGDLGSFLGDVLGAALDRLQPAGEALVGIFQDLADVGGSIYDALAPAVEVLAVLTGAAIIGGINVLAQGLKEVTGFFADNEEAAGALAVVIGTLLVGKVLTLISSFATLAKAQVFMAMVNGFWGVIPAISSFIGRVGAAEGQIGKLSTVAYSAFNGVKAAILSPQAAAVALTLAIIGIGQAIQQQRQEGEAFAKSLEKGFDPKHLSTFRSTLDNLNQGLDQTAAKMQQQRTDVGEIGRAVVDVIVPFTNLGDTLWDNIGKAKATTEEIKRVTEEYTKMYNALVTAARGSVEFKTTVGDINSTWVSAERAIGQASTKILDLNRAYATGQISQKTWKDGVAQQNDVIKAAQPILDAYHNKMDGILQTYLSFANKQGIQMPDPGASAAEWDKWGDAVGKAYIASQNLPAGENDLRGYLTEIADSASSAEDKLKSYKDMLDSILGAPLDLQEAQAAAGESFRKLAASIGENGPNFDPWTEGGAKVAQAMGEAKDKIIDLVTETAKQQGIPAANAQFATLMGRLHDTMAAAGQTDDQWAAMVQTMGLTPDQIAIAIALSDPQGAAKKIAEIDQKAKDAQKNKELSIQIKVKATDANAALQGFQVQWTNSAGVIQTANVMTQGTFTRMWDAASQQSVWAVNGIKDVDLTLKGLQVQVVGMDGTVSTVTISTNAKDVQPEVEGVQKLVQNVDGTFSIVTIQAKDDDAKDKLDKTKEKHDKLDKKKATIEIAQVGAEAALQQVESVRKQLANLDGNTATVTIITKEKTVKEEAEGGVITPGNVRYFAGGDSEVHSAQIAPGGAWRVWAEPETGGEAYIPLAKSKRGRSEKILSQVAGMFGLEVVQPRHFADGGFTNPWDSLIALTERLDSELNPKGWPTSWNVDIKSGKITGGGAAYTGGATIGGDDSKSGSSSAADSAQSAADELKQRLQETFDALSGPLRGLENAITKLGTTSNLSFQNIQDYYAQALKASKEFSDDVAQLQQMGLNSKTFQDIIAAGPDSLGFVRALLSGGAEGIKSVNDSVTQLDAMANAMGSAYTNALVPAKAATGGKTFVTPPAPGPVNLSRDPSKEGTGNTYVNTGPITLTFSSGAPPMSRGEFDTAMSAALQKVATKINTGAR